MLVRTPSPYPTESLFGFIIRVSQSNGYDTPQTILNYAGYKEGELRSTKFSIKKLSIILNCPEPDLNKISYNKYDHNNQLRIKLLTHDLGFTARDFLRPKKQIFCPECVIEKGFVEAFWDLNLAVSCPEHKSIPIETCPNCNQQIKFLRPGILKCTCGHKLSPFKDNKYTVHISVLELMSILKYKLENKSLIELSNTSKYPLNIFENQSLSSLILTILKLSQFNLLSKGNIGNITPYNIVNEASEVLQNWPAGYYDFLERLGNKLIAKHKVQTTGLRKQFEKFYISIFKHKHKANFDPSFLKDEFIKFGQDKWGKAIVDNKLLRNNFTNQNSSRFISKLKTSQKSGISPTTLRKWAEKHYIPTIKVNIGERVRYIMDSQSFDNCHRLTIGKTYTARGAAAFLQIPVSVLTKSKETGLYKIKYMPKHKTGYHEFDLEIFLKLLLNKSKLINSIDNDNKKNIYLSLEYVLKNIKFWSKTGKTNFLKEYINGNIQSIGRTGDRCDVIWFSKSDVDNFAKSSRTIFSNNFISKAESAQIVGCDAKVLAGLIDARILITKTEPNRIRVNKQSVTTFNNLYIPISKIAKTNKTTSFYLLKVCRKNNLEILSIPRINSINASFIKRKLQDKLISLLISQK